MKKYFQLSVFLVALVLSGCTISKIDTASTDTKENKKEDTETVQKKRAYTIDLKDNITRVSFIKSSEENNDIEVIFSGTSNVNLPRNITFSGSSGNVLNTQSYRGFQNVKFPFDGSIDYYIKPKLSHTTANPGKSGTTNTNSASDLRCRLRFSINEPGSWIVKVYN